MVPRRSPRRIADSSVHELPVIGAVVATGFGTVGAVFTTISDVTRPIGACVTAIGVSIMRYTGRVGRAMRATSSYRPR